MNVSEFKFLLSLIIGVALVYKLYKLFNDRIKESKPDRNEAFPIQWKSILKHRVDFYNRLSIEKKKEFESRIQYFLSSVKFTGIHTAINDTDRILVASGAVIMLFGFDKWHFSNLNEILIHADDFVVPGTTHKAKGLVGYGAMEGRMMLSRKALKDGFYNPTDGRNVAIHEFTHILDKEDGEIDGVLGGLMNEIDISPWLHLVHQKMNEIEQGGASIRKYGAANQIEFLSVVSECFFEAPNKMKIEHPVLYSALDSFFNPSEP